MSSIIEGFNYDVFISYRQKDNKHDGWVTEFVKNLNGELESTFKEEISVYFDINPHDGLMETHDVDASLKEKLKCLILIPVVSRTYCDPKSYAWVNELNEFIRMASADHFGKDIKLRNGNIASRILPVKIHNLDNEDLNLYLTTTGGVMRSIDFVYETSSGVERPLRVNENNPYDNINKTFYLDQINKLALAIKEIINSLQMPPTEIASARQAPSLAGKDQIRQKNSIAVLPFVDMSPKKDQEYFCDGVAEEIINSLVHIENFKVIARTSAFAFKNSQTDVREIGKRLDVETLLEGSIRKNGKNLRITVQLIKVSDGSHLWSERYDCEMKDIFAVQDEIAGAILENLKVKLLGKPVSGLVKRHTENIRAYNLYLKGTYCWQLLTPEGYRKAVEYFNEAIALDPAYALVYVGLAAINNVSTTFGSVAPGIAYPKAFEYATKALSIDNSLAEAYSILGNINTFYYWNRDEAERNFRHALEINPNSSLTHIYYSFLLTCTGRHREAVAEAKLAQELDPLSVYITTETGLALAYDGQYEAAIKEFHLTLTINPNYFYVHLMLGNLYYSSGWINEAIPELEKAAELSEGNPFVIAGLVCGYYIVGRTEEADRLFHELLKRAETEYVPPSSFYLVHRFRGEEDSALEWLGKACSEHDTFLPWLRISQVYVPEGSRYMELLKEMGL